MADALLRRLEHFIALSASDKHALEAAAGQKVRHFGAREDILHEGDRPLSATVILEGWAYRYRMLEDGRRQIMTLLLPGDVCDLDVSVLRRRDHSVATITPVALAEVPAEVLQDIAANAPRAMQALRWLAAVAEAMQREWTVSLGLRTALERLAHLFCELFLRLHSAGLAGSNTCELPLTQAELGEILGLSTVHVNRTLQELRGLGLVVLRGKELTILDLPALQRSALFSPTYLHLDEEETPGGGQETGVPAGIRKA